MIRPSPHVLARNQKRQEKTDCLHVAHAALQTSQPAGLHAALKAGLSPNARLEGRSLLQVALERAASPVWEALGKGRPPQACLDPFVVPRAFQPPTKQDEYPGQCPLLMLRALLDAGADATLCTLDGWSVLHTAASGRWWGTPLDLLIKAGANIRRSTRAGETVLHVLLNPGERALLNLGVYGLIPEAGKREVAPALLHHWIDRGAPLDVCDKAGRSVLEVAITAKLPNIQAAQALIERGVPWTRRVQRLVVERRADPRFAGLMARIHEKQLRALLAEIEAAPAPRRCRM